MFVCANSLYSIVRQAQQWKLPLELNAGEEGFKAIYTKNKKNGKAMHSSAARAPRAQGTNGTSTVVAPLLLAGDSFTIALPYRRLSSVYPGYPPFPLLYTTTACSIENFNLLLHNELCLRFSPSPALLRLRLLLQLRLLWRQRRRV